MFGCLDTRSGELRRMSPPRPVDAPPGRWSERLVPLGDTFLLAWSVDGPAAELLWFQLDVDMNEVGAFDCGLGWHDNTQLVCGDTHLYSHGNQSIGLHRIGSRGLLPVVCDTSWFPRSIDYPDFSADPLRIASVRH